MTIGPTEQGKQKKVNQGEGQADDRVQDHLRAFDLGQQRRDVLINFEHAQHGAVVSRDVV